MGLLDTVSGAFTSLDDYVGDLFNSIAPDFLTGGQSGFISDVLGGAVTGSAIAAISGGDIGKAALYGGVGGALNDDNFGQFGNEIGGAIQGYGVGGLGGALGGGLAAYANDAGAFNGGQPNASQAVEEQVTENPSVFNGQQQQTPPGGGGLLADKLKSFGLMKDNGDGTLLGKGLIAGIGSMANEASQKDIMEQNQKIAQENYKKKADVDYEAEQRRIAAFSNNPSFQVNRNG
jgi:hypothetical protein